MINHCVVDKEIVVLTVRTLCVKDKDIIVLTVYVCSPAGIILVFVNNSYSVFR